MPWKKRHVSTMQNIYLAISFEIISVSGNFLVNSESNRFSLMDRERYSTVRRSAAARDVCGSEIGLAYDNYRSNYKARVILSEFNIAVARVITANRIRIGKIHS